MFKVYLRSLFIDRIFKIVICFALNIFNFRSKKHLAKP